MFIVLNIGNTNIQWARVENGILGEVHTCKTAGFTLEKIHFECQLVASCVVPEVRRRLEKEKLRICWLEHDLALGIDLSAVDSATLGADRLANIVKLYSEGVFPALCIDAGTAVTFELLDENGAFIGGAIAPGRKIMSNSLNQYTALLPKVKPGRQLERFPGRDTLCSIKAGVDYSFLGSVMELTRQSEIFFKGTKLRKVVIGGDAQLLQKNIDHLEYGGEDYTLRGIQKAWEIINQ